MDIYTMLENFKIMKREKIHKVILSVIVLAAFAHGFSEGMEWHRLLCCGIGGYGLGALSDWE